jgi:AAA+ superfamily predicted ATPase
VATDTPSELDNDSSASKRALGGAGGSVRLPEGFPGWARRLAELYFSGSSSMFVLHGSTFDLVPFRDGEEVRYGGLAEFLAEQLFGRWDLILHYDLARGLRAFAGSDEKRLREMVALANRRVADLSELGRDPTSVLAALDRFVRMNVMAKDEDRLRTAVILNHASYVAPSGAPQHMSLTASTHLVTLLNWASSPHVRRLNMAFLLCDEKLSTIAERLTSNPHVATIELTLPDEDERRDFIGSCFREEGAAEIESYSDFGQQELATLTAGISLTDINVLLRATREGGRRLDAAAFREIKKNLLERQAQGFLEFIEPKFGLEMVIGHEAAKARLREDSALLRRGALHTVPMGYLICGAVGTGKTFLAQCAAADFGIPCVILKNFRSKYVGETEGNLERILSVLRAMGPVLVVVDEADAALGDRNQEGDSGTSGRVFGMIAAQMGNTRYRGRILWMLLTCRPDFLPIDLKRQGRAEVHIPLFYPSDRDEVRDLFVAMAKKLGTRIDPEDVPQIPQIGEISGADIEGMVGRAWRRSLLADSDQVTREALLEVVSNFLPSIQGLEKELQETVAVLECTDSEFLPRSMQERLLAGGGRAELQERASALRRLVDGL